MLNKYLPLTEGYIWLMSRQGSSSIGSMNIKTQREVDVFYYMLITYWIEWKPCNHKSHYTQIWKDSHGYIERVQTTKLTSSWIHTWPKLHINKHAKLTIESKKNSDTANNYISLKLFACIGILFIHSTFYNLFYALAFSSTCNMGVGPARELVNTSEFRWNFIIQALK